GDPHFQSAVQPYFLGQPENLLEKWSNKSSSIIAGDPHFQSAVQPYFLGQPENLLEKWSNKSSSIIGSFLLPPTSISWKKTK
ncbi:hypothetical protein, partial [Gordoniibacillus kamchatkensis]|uniref:hypothetical protein n=1 Tax=Gordoniibacillus kamchatkensis TaxID=1590651 RepID=UPI001E57F178